MVLRDGRGGLYVRVKRGVYREVDRQGRGTGVTATGFTPRVRWKPAARCAYVIATDGLWCPACGTYDNHYAATGERSYCRG